MSMQIVYKLCAKYRNNYSEISFISGTLVYSENTLCSHEYKLDNLGQKFYTAFATDKYILTYELGKTTVPKNVNSKLFAFNNQTNIKNFLNDSSRGIINKDDIELKEFNKQYVILECETDSGHISKMNDLLFPLYEKHYDLFWENILETDNTLGVVPACKNANGTILCDSIKPIRVIEYKNLK